MNKKEAIEAIENIPDTTYNKHQKKTIIDILSFAPEDQIENWFKILSHKVKKGFVFDETTYEPEVLGKIFSLKENKKLSISGESKNIFIKGDNFNSLKNLLLTHKEKIDIIYIDPPYDTENMDSENNFLSEDETKKQIKKQEENNGKFIAYMDKFTTTGWLNSFKMRMELAFELLSDEGIFFMSIDDVHQADSRIILDEIFGTGNFVGTIIHQKKSGGGQAKFYFKGHDYIHVYAKNKKNLNNGLLIDDNIKDVPTQIINGEKFGYNTDIVRREHGKYEKTGLHRNISYEELEATNPKKFEDWKRKIDDENYTLIKDENTGNHWISKCWRIGDKTKKLYSILNQPTTLYNKLWNSDAKVDLEKIIPFGSSIFETPKPVDLIKLLISTTKNPNAIVLDFYAGSATTAQAVLELNEEDGGNRQFIVCTNEEGGTYLTIAYERIYRLLNKKAFNKKIDIPIRKNGNIISYEKDVDYSKFDYFANKPIFKNSKNEGMLFFDEISYKIEFANSDELFIENIIDEISKIDSDFSLENNADIKINILKR